MKRISKKNLIKLSILSSMVLTCLALFLIRYIPGVSEGWSRTISRFYHFIFGKLNSVFPFSVFEVLIYSAIAFAIYWIVSFIIETKKYSIKTSWTRILTLLIVITSVITTYTAIAGMEYQRNKVDIPQETEIITDTEKYYDIGKYYIKDINYCSSKMNYQDNGSSICPYTYDAINDLMKREFERLTSDYYSSFTYDAKRMYLTSWLYTELRITGVSFAPTGEANVNIFNCPGDIPFTMAHEISHQKGVMREEDANLVALYICLTSDNWYLRYSAYLNCVGSLFELFKAMNDEGKYNELYYMVNKNFFNDINFINNYWRSHNVLDKVSKFFNDLYLMISASETTDAYIDHTHTEEHHEGGEIIYTISEYSPYQSLLLYLYNNK